jgi:hypothetical protein
MLSCPSPRPSSACPAEFEPRPRVQPRLVFSHSYKPPKPEKHKRRAFSRDLDGPEATPGAALEEEDSRGNGVQAGPSASTLQSTLVSASESPSVPPSHSRAVTDALRDEHWDALCYVHANAEPPVSSPTPSPSLTPAPDSAELSNNKRRLREPPLVIRTFLPLPYQHRLLHVGESGRVEPVEVDALGHFPAPLVAHTIIGNKSQTL